MKRILTNISIFALMGFTQLSAQTIINASNPDNMLYGVSSPMGKFPSINTGVAVRNYLVSDPNNVMGTSHAVSVWDDPSGNSTLHWTANQVFSAGSLTIPNAKDPDVEFDPATGLTAYVGYIDATNNQVYISWYATTGGPPTDFSFQGVMPFPTTNPINSVNIDVSNYGDFNDFGLGVITWDESGVIYASSFYISSSAPSTFVISTPALVGYGSQPDISVSGEGRILEVVYIDDLKGDLIIKQSNIGDLMMGNFPGYTYTFSSGDGEYTEPRIARSHYHNGTYHDEFTAVAREITSSNLNKIVAFTSNNSGMNTYEVSVGAGNTMNRKPVVCYNQERIKFAWASQYGLVSSTENWELTSPGNPGEDVLLAEFDRSTLSSIQMFEVNTVQGAFHTANPAIAEARWDDAYNLNAFVYNYVTPNGFAIYNKKLLASATPKRLSIQKDEEMTLTFSNENYTLSAENLKDYQFQIFDIEGKRIDLSNNMEMNDQELIINTQGLTRGMYVLQCSSAKKAKTFKLLVQ